VGTFLRASAGDTQIQGKKTAGSDQVRKLRNFASSEQTNILPSRVQYNLSLRSSLHIFSHRRTQAPASFCQNTRTSKSMYGLTDFQAQVSIEASVRTRTVCLRKSQPVKPEHGLLLTRFGPGRRPSTLKIKNKKSQPVPARNDLHLSLCSFSPTPHGEQTSHFHTRVQSNILFGSYLLCFEAWAPLFGVFLHFRPLGDAEETGMGDGQFTRTVPASLSALSAPHFPCVLRHQLPVVSFCGAAVSLSDWGSGDSHMPDNDARVCTIGIRCEDWSRKEQQI
jgi:hypothetical protein